MRIRISPPVVLIFSTLILVLSISITFRVDKSILYNRISSLILLYSLYLNIFSVYIVNIYKGIAIYGGLFYYSNSILIFQIFILTISIIILHITGFFPYKEILNRLNCIYPILYSDKKKKIINVIGQQFKILEYSVVILFIIIGSMFLIATNDIVSIFLSIELQSYGLYILCTLYRNSELSTYGGLTYFLLGGLSSCFILLGSSLLYSNSGLTSLENIYIINNIKDILNEIIYTNVYNSYYINNNIFFWYGSDYINNSLLILGVGFLFKVSAAPFHNWSPDVYDSIPTIVTTFVAIIAKISIFIFLLGLVYHTFNNISNNVFTWTIILIISSILSLIIGSVLGLAQNRIKRLLAYSTISHVGFILLALSINSIESTQAFFFYLMQYTISNLNIFIILISIGFSLYFYINETVENKELIDKELSPIQFTNQLKGYFYINPFLAVSLAITIFSFLGVPPLIGFFAKQMVLSAALDNGYIFISLVAILTSVISAVYYLNIIKTIFFEKPKYIFTEQINKNIIILSSALTNFISLLTIIIIVFMFIPSEWLSIANILALILFNS